MYQKGTHNFPFIYVSTSSSYNIRYYVLLVAVSPIYLFMTLLYFKLKTLDRPNIFLSQYPTLFPDRDIFVLLSPYLPHPPMHLAH